jgi:hypothetical protein
MTDEDFDEDNSDVETDCQVDTVATLSRRVEALENRIDGFEDDLRRVSGGGP